MIYKNGNDREKLACILACNTSDLQDKIQVCLDAAVNYAQKNNMLFVQISAKMYDWGNVQLLFRIAARYATMRGKIYSYIIVLYIYISGVLNLSQIHELA